MITIYKNALDTTNPHYVEIDSILDRIKKCKDEKQILAIRSETDDKKKKELKKMLPSILFAGEFKNRTDDGIIKHSGYCVLDFDHLTDVTAKKEEVSKHNFVYAAFISPSGDGLKVVIKIPPIKEKHSGYYNGLMNVFLSLDSTSRNLSRVCFISADKDIYINKEAVEFTNYIKTFQTLPPIEKNTVKYASYTNYNKANRALEMIRNSIDGNKHETLLKASKLMGGFISGGAVEEMEAIRLLENEISKKDIVDLESAKVTILKGIEHGKLTPLQDIEKEISIKPISTGIKTIDTVWEIMKKSFYEGKKRGETTHFEKFNQNFTWKSGEITLIIGRPNSGKTEFALQLMLLKSVYDGWKWAVFSPENYPEDEFYDSLIHSYIGKTTDPFYNSYQMSYEEYHKGYLFIREHFFYIYPEELHTMEEIEGNFLYLINEKNINGTFLDPFNQIITNMDGLRDDQFLSKFLTERKKFALKHNLCDVISSHPKSMSVPKGSDFKAADIYDIAGGAMWGNKMDNIISVHRPNYLIDPKDTKVEIHIKKIKKQKLVGIPGICEFDFKRTTNRYYFNDETPFEKKISDNPKAAISSEKSSFYESKQKTIDDNDSAPF